MPAEPSNSEPSNPEPSSARPAKAGTPTADPTPTKLELVAGRLRIGWSDARTREYTVRELRDACPCATCREKRSQPPAASPLLPVLSAAETRPLTIGGMQPVGNYAYSIAFSDGHDTGIYTLTHLRQLGREMAG